MIDVKYKARHYCGSYGAANMGKLYTSCPAKLKAYCETCDEYFFVPEDMIIKEYDRDLEEHLQICIRKGLETWKNS